ncbi:jg15664 [Pararge aegeria aegeria]|uniref:Jg15664 protein n=1 Tax=Pararge aegeria aegeria TaxID=348720 RepID=A0A8S4RSU6_9NEOP|nr:jg15664 [Pararge aegeria aegeria]
MDLVRLALGPFSLTIDTAFDMRKPLLDCDRASITDSPLCRACMEADGTPTHVLLQCRGVAERAAYLGSPASLSEALGDLGGLLSFWSELGWLE